MIHVIIVALLFTFALVVWNLVHFSPRSLAMFIPDRVSLILGLVLLPLGAFSALAAGYGERNVVGFIGSVVIALVGLWFLLIRSSARDITGDAEQLIRRVFLMMALLRWPSSPRSTSVKASSSASRICCCLPAASG